MKARSSQDKVARTAELVLWCRALARATDPMDIANADRYAAELLSPMQRALIRSPRFMRWMMERGLPGAVGYFNARTRHLDALLQAEIDRGLEQFVILGAGLDSRALRFSESLQNTRVFELDLPLSVEEKKRRLRTIVGKLPERVKFVGVDFEAESLSEKLSKNAFSSGQRTFFLWEGVTYYLPLERVDSMLRAIAACAPKGSSIGFDYTPEDFFKGQHNSYGSTRLADSWRKLGNVHRSGIANVGDLLGQYGLHLRSDVDSAELERRYLVSSTGVTRRAWGCFRIAHAEL